jgi:hypothetical protein
MARLRMHNFTISLDGYAGGPDHCPEEPLGDGGRRLHEWISCTVRLWVPAAFCGRRRSRRPRRGDNCACPASPHASCGGLGLNAATAGVVFVDLTDRGGLTDPDGIAVKIRQARGRRAVRRGVRRPRVGGRAGCEYQCQTHMSPGRPAPTAGAAAERTDRVQRPPGPGPPRGF